MRRVEWIRRLIRLVEESEIDTLDVSRFATRVRISKSPTVVVGGGVDSSGVSTAASPGSSGAPGAGQAAAADEPADDLHDVTSPMVGTFYCAPAPDAPAYVEVGDRVTKGQTLCILEAMKLMNELESEIAGTVREVAVQNAEPVEYGQLLFRIESDGTG